MKKEILYEGKYFNVVNKERNGGNMIGIETFEENVIVLPYTLSESGQISKVGIMHEFNTLRDGSYSNTCITGDIEKGEDALQGAKRELLEESGYNQEDNEKWKYLGNLTTSKLVEAEHPCFIVDITGLKQSKAEKDGSVNEEKSEFKLVELSEILLEEDSFILSMLMKLYVNKFGGVFK